MTKSGGFFPHSLLKSCPMTKLKLSLHVTNRMWLADSVIRNGTITPLWQSLRNYFVFDQVLNPLWYILFAIGQIFTVVNGQMLNNDLAVGSQTHTVDKCQMTSTAATEWRPHIQEIIAPNFIFITFLIDGFPSQRSIKNRFGQLLQKIIQLENNIKFKYVFFEHTKMFRKQKHET